MLPETASEQEGKPPMNLDTVSDKHLHELERLAGELLAVIQKAKLKDDLLVAALRQLEYETGQVRRSRYDTAASEYSGY
jgi:hypothetical protein